MRSSANSRLPVIFLTARNRVADGVRGLDAGGDDYVVKPAKRRKLIARVDSLPRRHGIEADNREQLEFARYSVGIRRRRIAFLDKDIEPTQREFDLAAVLFRRHGRIVSSDSQRENVCNLSASVSARTVDTHLSRLRKKLELSGEHGWRLAAICQHGCRLEQT